MSVEKEIRVRRTYNRNISMNAGITITLLLIFTLKLDSVHSFILPCINCRELHVELHQNETLATQPIFSGQTLCPETCKCSAVLPKCQDGVPIVLDGCSCCPVCARQQGDVCNKIQVCDSTRKLQCTYTDPFSLTGICRVRSGQSCRVGGAVYQDGETFKMDCRTQCTCQNGTYGCVSLCPHEKVRPSSRCRHPQLVEVSHDKTTSCCREWLCESTVREDRERECQHYSSQWTPCSQICGMGMSTRVSNDNPDCRLKNDTRICLLRPCSELQYIQKPVHGHHKNHQCRATIRSTAPVRFTDGANCTSLDMYQPKYCGVCTTFGHCCEPHATTTKKIPFYCNDEDGPNIIEKDVLWIIKCTCSTNC